MIVLVEQSAGTPFDVAKSLQKAQVRRYSDEQSLDAGEAFDLATSLCNVQRSAELSSAKDARSIARRPASRCSRRPRGGREIRATLRHSLVKSRPEKMTKGRFMLKTVPCRNRTMVGEQSCDVNERPTERLLNAVVEDEGRPLGIGVQKPAPNQAVLL